MPNQTLLLVALPNGTAPDGSLRVSVYLGPRLAGAPTLGDFPDLLDWPDLVQRHGLRVTLACAGTSVTVPVARAGLRPDLWKEIFKPATYVAPFPRPDYDRRIVVSYPTRTVQDYLRWAYQTAATRANTGDQRLLPILLEDLVFRDGDVSTLDAQMSQARLELWREQRAAGEAVPRRAGAGPRAVPAASLPQKPADTRLAATRFALYHHLPPAPGARPLPSTPADFEHVLDFHKAIASLTAYPALLRALGLVFDVTLPASTCPDSPDGAGAYGQLAVSGLQPGWAWHVAPRTSLPATAYVRDATRFEAAPATAAPQVAAGQYAAGDIAGGFLALSPDDFQLTGVDLDGAMLKALMLADNVAAVSDPESIEPVLPSLRTGGISLLADDRAQEVLRAIADNTGLQQAEDAGTGLPRALNARDVARGFRLDIWSAGDGAWRSLHRRNGVYRFGADGGLVYSTSDEEGFTQLGVAQPMPDPTRPADPASTAAGAPQPGTDLYVHERVARWHGWSLSAPRPGRPLNRAADPGLAADDDPTANTPATPFKMQASFTAAAGSLPRLRFGERYRMRARAVDLAGNSVPLAAVAPAGFVAPAGNPVPYLRFEPVPSPVVVLRAAPGPGGSLLRLAIRSYNASPALDAVPTAQTDERHIVPPKADVRLVEHHGRFDDAAGRVKGGAATYDLVVARDQGAFGVVDGAPLEPAAQAATPWFPDPLARGAAFSTLPQAPDDTTGDVQPSGTLRYDVLPDVQPRPGAVTRIPFDGAWPEALPFRLVLVEGSQPPAWDAAARTLTVACAKSAVTSVQASSWLTPADLDLMGVWDWMRAWYEDFEAFAMQQPGGGPQAVAIADAQALITRLVLEGGHEMITPAETLTLVHAVQQPLGAPTWRLLPVTHAPGLPAPGPALPNAFSPLIAWRSLGSHHAVLLGALAIHGASTARIDLQAAWTEYLDDLAQPGPTTQAATDHADAIELRDLGVTTVPADGAASRFVACYLARIDTLWFAAPFDQLAGVDSPPQLAAPLHAFGDTRHRRVRYQAIATSRFAEYFPEPGLDLTRAGRILRVDVPSSARPAAPDILYVVPTFGWERQESSNVKVEVRLGNGLRVYLNRPWYSSGEGEQLGVVLWPQSRPGPTDADRDTWKNVFTQWGLDPIWGGGTLDETPAPSQFPQAVATGSNLVLEEATLPVDVAGHTVAYDARRQLWYCDIELAADSAYTPFVRLALARYQPRSIAGVELSHVVLADFAQLSPDRSASLSVDPADPATGRLFVGGRAPAGPTTSFVTVSVDKRDPAIASDMGWAPAPIADVHVVADSPAPAQSESVLWSGAIVFATAPHPGDYRVVVREFEVHAIDPFAGDVAADPVNHGERLVYASVIEWNF